MPANVALLGSGLFAEAAYLPALQANPSDITLHTIWSRSSSSANKLLEAAKSLGLKTSSSNGNIAVQHGDDGLEAVLNDKDVDAVIIVLPISRQPEFVLKALSKGKHVLSEKPVAKDVQTARETIERYEKEYKPKGLIWRVAENYAHEPMIRKARKVLSDKALGPILYYNLRSENNVPDGSKYQATTWRTVPDYQGGFLLDGGVHTTAILRTVLPETPSALTAFASLHRTHMLPHDTVTALLAPAKGSETDSHGPQTKLTTADLKPEQVHDVGKSRPEGQLFISFATPSLPEAERDSGGLTVTCLHGVVTLKNTGYPRKWVVKVVGAENSDVKDQTYEGESEGVKIEVGMYGRAVSAAKGGKSEQEENWAEPRGALWDLAVIEACLKSQGKEVDLDQLVGKQ